MDTDRHEVDGDIEALAQQVYELVSDVTLIGESSPETYRCEPLERIVAFAEGRS